MPDRKAIYEGKAKILYKGPQPGTLIQYFKDDATAFNNQKHEKIEGKGVLNNRISEYIFLRLGEMGIKTHFIRYLNMREQLIQEAEIIPVEIVIRNIAAGGLVKRLGLKEGDKLPRPLIEFYYKNDALGDPLISEDHINSFGWAQPSELEEIVSLSFRINDYLSGLFQSVGIKLVDFKLEFGRIWDKEGSHLILADEISPDNCRLWDIHSGDKLDKDRFRQDLGGLIEAYQDVANRFGIFVNSKDKSKAKPRPRLVK
ncbi:MAG: phosphoribosylaminoimidazolesuccinocarboxamide synthase [Parvibaculales bacterium]